MKDVQMKDVQMKDVQKMSTQGCQKEVNTKCAGILSTDTHNSDVWGIDASIISWVFEPPVFF